MCCESRVLALYYICKCIFLNWSYRNGSHRVSSCLVGTQRLIEFGTDSISTILMKFCTRTWLKNEHMGPMWWLNKLILHLKALAAQMGTGLCLNCFTFHPALCLLPEKAAEVGSGLWAPVPTRENQKKLLSPDFRSALLGCCGHLGSKPVDGRYCLSVTPPPRVCISRKLGSGSEPGTELASCFAKRVCLVGEITFLTVIYILTMICPGRQVWDFLFAA